VPDFQWDPVRRVYIKPNGKIVTPAEQRKIGLRITAKSAEALEALTAQYEAGSIAFEEWAIGMREGVKATHSAMSQLAFGGKEQMGARQRGLLGSILRKQYSFLANFLLKVEAGVDTPSSGRAAQYGQSGWISYTESIGQREKYAGMQEERSFLEPDADHCQECFDEAAKGWSPIGSLVPVGERTCRSNDQCEFEYR
jgi:hypothetical protein